MSFPLVVTPQILADAALESAGVLFITDLAHRIVWVNTAFVRATGFSLDDVRGLDPGAALMGPEHNRARAALVMSALEAGERVNTELTFYRKDGTQFSAALAIGQLYDGGGAVIGYQTNFIDITAVLTAERRLADILRGTRAGTWEWNIQTGEVRFNERWAEIVGFTLDELQPVSIETWTALAHPDDLAASATLLEQHFAGKLPYYDYLCRMRHKLGHDVWVHDRGQVVEWSADGGPVWMAGTHIDVSDMVNTTEALRDARDRAQHVLDTVQSVLVSLDCLGRVTQVNSAASGLLAMSETFMLGRNWFTELGLYDDGPSKLDDYREMVTGSVALTDWTESEIITASGGRRLLRWHHVKQVDDQGTCIGFLSSGEDITELRQLERLATRRQRLESIGTLAGGIAHDLNNALSPAVMGMGLLRDAAPSETALLDMIEASTRRASLMVGQLLAFARGAEGERQPLDLGTVVREVERLVRTTFPKNITVTMSVPPGLPLIIGDATQVHQVLVNLAVNARDAMPHGGHLDVLLSEVDVDVDMASRVTAAPAHAGRYIRLSVRDTGEGMAEGLVDRIFDPFYTTKGPDRGTGLGLSTVLGILKGHDGFVRVDSMRGVGSTFHVYLPVPDGHVSAARERPVRDAKVSHRLVLLVDDEPLIRSVATMLAHRIGTSAVTAESAADALQQLRRPGNDISAVVTDLHMPGRDGLALTRDIRREWPDLPVVIASGLLTDELAEEVRGIPNVSILPKPFSEQQLRVALEQSSEGASLVALPTRSPVYNGPGT